MQKFILEGGRPLRGDVFVGGSKNAALPLLFATLVTEGTSVIKRLPEISDIRVTLALLRAMGAEVTAGEDGGVRISTVGVHEATPPPALVRRIRASTYLLGAMLVRFGRARIGGYGGCDFSARPIDMHIAAAQAFGAVREGDLLVARRLHGAVFRFHTVSVGATVNALLLAASAEGESRLENIALEPHVLALVDFLRSAGARIELFGRTAEITGTRLHGGEVQVIPDMIEAGTYLLAGLCTGGCVRVHGIDPVELRALTDLLSFGGVSVEARGNILSAEGRAVLPLCLHTAAYPGFPTDLQPQTASFLAVSAGGEITEGVFPERFGYLDQLARFGVCASAGEGHAVISPSALHAACVRATDLRGGVAAVLTALSAKGRSEIREAEPILRGYERLAQKLTALGAHIRLVAED